MTPSNPAKLKAIMNPPIAKRMIVAASSALTLIIDCTASLFVILFKSESELHLKIAAVINMANTISRNIVFIIPRTILIKEPKHPVFEDILIF